eukprot:g1432.t1
MASQKQASKEAASNPTSNAFKKRNELGPVERIKTWLVNFIDLPNEELVKLVYDLFQDVLAGLEFYINNEALVCFVTAVASHYRENPYHNFLHACHVFHAVWMVLKETNLVDYLLPHDQLALCIAALCHDVDHTGFTNQYHINIGSEVAKRYNEVSVLENHHCALSFAILERKNCAILDRLPKDIQSEVRKTIIKLILATDMSNHFKMTSELCQLELPEGPGDESVRLLLCKAVLHAADISNPVRSFDVDFWMSERVQQEFKIQTEKEKELGLPVSPHMDIKNEVMKYQAEVNFIDFIVTPLWKRLAQLFPPLEICIHQTQTNKKKFEQLVLQAST